MGSRITEAGIYKIERLLGAVADFVKHNRRDSGGGSHD